MDRALVSINYGGDKVQLKLRPFLLTLVYLAKSKRTRICSKGINHRSVLLLQQ